MFNESSRKLGIAFVGPASPQPPDPKAEDKVCDPEGEMTSTEQGEQPPGVADDSVEDATAILLQVSPRVWSGTIPFGKADDRHGYRRWRWWWE